MNTRLATIVALFIPLGAAVVAYYFYPELPDRIVTHWNASGDADGYMGKFWGVVMFPIILGALSILFFVLPTIDPLKENVKAFRPYYNLLIIAILVFLAYAGALSFVWNLGARFDFGKWLMPGLGILLFILGTILPHTKRNWFVGIRTPWTLSSDAVWEKTHIFSGRIFRALGVLATLGTMFASNGFFIVFISAIVVSVVAMFLYSYMFFRRHES